MFLRTIFFTFLLTTPICAEPLVLNLPIDCKLGKTCFVQQYMDVDPTRGARDFGGGTVTYDGHKGTDFRLSSQKAMHAGVRVVASAGGSVKRVRDGMGDQMIRTDADRARIKGKECGNGVVIDHGEGWETQYCHMKRGSIIVVKGQQVLVGDVLGQVGLSGKTQFPHVHIAVRKDGQKVDPFDPDANLWAKALRPALTYRPTRIINIGFADGAVKMVDIMRGKFDGFSPTKTAPALVAFVRAINLVKGDQIRLTMKGPKGGIAAKLYDAVPRAKAHQMYFTGKKRPAGGWPLGGYLVQAVVLRDGVVVDAETFEVTTK